MKIGSTPPSHGVGFPTVPATSIYDFRFRRYGPQKPLFCLYLGNGKSHRLVVGIVGKLAVELCETEVGCKWLGRSVRVRVRDRP